MYFFKRNYHENNENGTEPFYFRVVDVTLTDDRSKGITSYLHSCVCLILIKYIEFTSFSNVLIVK